MMIQFLSDLKTKIATDVRFFLDYWLIWIGIGVVVIGLWLYLKYREDDDGKEKD